MITEPMPSMMIGYIMALMIFDLSLAWASRKSASRKRTLSKAPDASPARTMLM